MDVSLGALRERLLEMRAWDSSGTTFDKRVREALNMALDRLAGDVPEALIPDEEHIVLHADVSSSTVAASLARVASYANLLKFVDSAGADLGASSRTTWRPTVDGTWDGIMHLEITDSAGTVHRRQSREWWVDGNVYYVSLERPWRDDSGSDIDMSFRIYQPEFFMTDDVMQVLEPARVWDDTRQQVWAIDTAGAYRQDMVDFKGETTGRPYRFWRGRHFQIPAPRQVPLASPSTVAGPDGGGPATPWLPAGAKGEQQGDFRFRFTYVWGRKDEEWQDAPLGTRDPMWESAPSPESAVFSHAANPGDSIRITTTNIDAMTDYGDSTKVDHGKSGLRIRIYVARDSVRTGGSPGGYDRVEAAGVFYFLTEIEPTDTVTTAGVTYEASFSWDGTVQPDYYRPLKHSTGYYAYKAYPHQDARYELDFRVLRLPRKFIADTDTAPIQRDAVSALTELALYYVALQDGADQAGASIHLDRYIELARRYRTRYANPGRIVEPVPIGGHITRRRYGTFSASE
jgi:hypothetical protein